MVAKQPEKDGLFKEGKRPKKSRTNTLHEASVSDIIAFSKFTLIGFGLVILTIIAWAILQAIDYPNNGQIGVGLIAIFALIFFLGLIVDLLRWRNYTEWGALGAIIAYFGIFLILTPLVLNMFSYLFPEQLLVLRREQLILILEFGLSWYEVVILIGAIVTIIGFTSRATELDQKIANLIFIVIERFKNFDFKEFLKTLGILIKSIISGTIRTLGRGVKEFGSRLKRFGGYIKRTASKFIIIFKIFLTVTLPHTVKKFFQVVWNNLHWVGLGALALILVFSNASTENLFLNIELIIIMGFFFSLGVIYPYQTQITKVITSTRNIIFKGAISAYSMLSGVKLKYHNAVYCSRCLRGIEKTEFESLQVIKNTDSPPCSFCGYTNWLIPTKKYDSEEILPREARVPEISRQPPTITTTEDYSCFNIDKTSLKSQEEMVIEEPTDEEIIKKIKKGNFPNYESFCQGQVCGAQTYNELKFINRLGAPDLETAKKIIKTGFAHYQTYKRALEVGSSTLSEFKLVETIKAPNYETAKRVQELGFPDYRSYLRAQELGAKDQTELEFIENLEAPDLETAIKVMNGGFPDFKTYQIALKLGISDFSQYKTIIVIKKLIEKGEEFDSADRDIQEWINWFKEQFELYKQKKISQDIIQNMIQRSELFLQNKKEISYLQSSDHSNLRENIQSSVISDLETEEQSEIEWWGRKIQKDRPKQKEERKESIIMEDKPILTLLELLFKQNEILSEIDEVIESSHKRLLQQRNLFYNRSIGVKEFKNALINFKQSLLKLDIGKWSLKQRNILEEIIELINSILKIYENSDASVEVE